MAAEHPMHAIARKLGMKLTSKASAPINDAAAVASPPDARNSFDSLDASTKKKVAEVENSFREAFDEDMWRLLESSAYFDCCSFIQPYLEDIVALIGSNLSDRVVGPSTGAGAKEKFFSEYIARSDK